MKPRHNSLERVGIHFIAQVIEEEFEWIFREQSVADVGIDAVVEYCRDGNPTGQLIALQIKSGEGNVKKTTKGYTYYISNTHYYYWINHQLPVILTCYIKGKKKKVYWAEISKATVKATKTKWKIDIPIEQILNIESREAIENIIHRGSKVVLRSSNKEKQEIDKEIYKISAVKPMNISLVFLTNYTNTLTENIQQITEEAKSISLISDKVDQAIKLEKMKFELNYIMSGFATRTSSEIKTYAQLYSDFLSGIKCKHKIISGQPNGQDEKTKDISSVNSLKNSFDIAIEGIQKLNNSLSLIKELKMLKDKADISLAISATDQVINELEISKRLAEELINALNGTTSITA